MLSEKLVRKNAEIVMKFKSNTLNLKRLSEVAFNINTVPTRKETQRLKSPVSKLSKKQKKYPTIFT